MLTAPTRGRAWSLLWDFALIDIVFRFLHSAESAEFEPGRSIFLQFLPPGEPGFGAALAAAALDYQWQAMPPDADVRPLLERRAVLAVAQACRRALKISNDESASLEGTLVELGPLLADREPGVAAMRRFLARPAAAAARELLEALARAGLHAQRIAWLRGRLAELERLEVAPAPLISGDDLVAAGFRPGPLFRRVLDGVYDAQLEGRITSRQAAMDLARHMFAGT
jgi:hypothetical protein